MNEIYLTGCTHYGHFNIIRYCNRPFKTLEEMDKILIRNTNERVKDNNILYHLGDFCFKNSPGGKKGEGSLNRADYYLNQINSPVIVVAGNHDSNNGLRTKNQRIIIHYAEIYFQLIHNPAEAIVRDDKYYYPCILHSHVHTAWAEKEMIDKNGNVSLLINCGVDVRKFRPISMKEVMVIFYRWLNSRPDKSRIKTLIHETNKGLKIYRRNRNV
ncbi:MAG: metallophosphoesterase [Candidatus Helarchaeota archaeon]